VLTDVACVWVVAVAVVVVVAVAVVVVPMHSGPVFFSSNICLSQGEEANATSKMGQIFVKKTNSKISSKLNWN